MIKPLIFNYQRYEELRQAYKDLLQDNQTLMADNKKLRDEITNLKARCRFLEAHIDE